APPDSGPRTQIEDPPRRDSGLDGFSPESTAAQLASLRQFADQLGRDIQPIDAHALQNSAQMLLTSLVMQYLLQHSSELSPQHFVQFGRLLARILPRPTPAPDPMEDFLKLSDFILNDPSFAPPPEAPRAPAPAPRPAPPAPPSDLKSQISNPKSPAPLDPLIPGSLDPCTSSAPPAPHPDPETQTPKPTNRPTVQPLDFSIPPSSKPDPLTKAAAATEVASPEQVCEPAPIRNSQPAIRNPPAPSPKRDDGPPLPRRYGSPCGIRETYG
ncbi:MAG TPA: hypothetical protein VGM03_06150, partial [Phycisphaerae bacterium]